MEKEQAMASGAGLIYGLNDRPPLKETIFAALQHLLAIFVAIITPPLIIWKLQVFGINGIVCIRCINFYSMS